MIIGEDGASVKIGYDDTTVWHETNNKLDKIISLLKEPADTSITVKFGSEDSLDYKRFVNRNDMAGLIYAFGKWFRDQRKYREDEPLTADDVWEMWYEAMSSYDIDWVDV